MTEFTFTKKANCNLAMGDESFRHCSHYIIFENETPIAEFLYRPFRGFFITPAGNYRLKIKRPTFKKTSFEIVDNSNGFPVGNYSITPWLFKQNEHGLLNYSNNQFTLRKEKPGIKYKLFDTKTWGHLRFVFTGATANISYDLQLLQTSLFNNYSNRDVSGKIRSTSNDLLLILSPFFLIENTFVNWDS